MRETEKPIPEYLYTVHPGSGQCGMQGMRNEPMNPASGQHVYVCKCGFRWYLSRNEIAELVSGDTSSTSR